ncbi:four helix bundle protein [Empedobacter stercoris]|uniref:four helix bundle protein n=1 Tax=Empedobacter stercoris TaxID=1628248 RepID=UPI0021B08499|nr:four helix bundle protein [Empedobacter stercoris]UWX66022.1 four helix bundle protein [Empedobacter stercoris]
MRTHKDLDVWKLSIDFVTVIFTITKGFPKEEQFGLTNQIRRAAVSVPSNIAEGAGRKSDKEFLQFLYISLGSVQEIDTQILISLNLNYLTKSEYEILLIKLDQISKMLSGLIKSVKEKLN